MDKQIIDKQIMEKQIMEKQVKDIGNADGIGRTSAVHRPGKGTCACGPRSGTL